MKNNNSKRKGSALADLMRESRQSAGICLRAVEAGTGISNSSISAIEANKTTNPGIRTIIKLIKYYRLELKHVWEAIEEDEQNETKGKTKVKG